MRVQCFVNFKLVWYHWYGNIIVIYLILVFTIANIVKG